MKSKNQPAEYAIVDIETTGGYASGSSITEIAILVHDGETVVERFVTLVNPKKEIPLPIFALTGIDNEMVRDAPVFEEIAGKVFEMLQGRVFVAHSVNFDYSFVRHQLEQAGYKFSASKLCTVRLSRKIRQGLPSYSLGNLCHVLRIPISDRHRAGGDADATAILFSRLLQWDTEGVLPAMLKKNSGEQRLPPNLPQEDFDALPSCPGVYYFRDRGGKVIYVGKAVNLKKRVASHFTGHNPNPQRQHFLRNIYSISFEPCATELMALLLECLEIKRLWPAYNRALKRFEPKFGLYSYEDQNGYIRLAVGKLAKHQHCIQPFGRLYDAVKTLNALVEQFQLDHRLCVFGLGEPQKPAGFVQSALLSAGQDTALPDAGEYNERVNQALDHLLEKQPTFAILDKGRDEAEKSCIWVEKGNFYAMGYFSAESDLTEPEDIRDSLQRCPSNYYSMQLIYTFAERYPGKVLTFARNSFVLA
ncbi:DNA polymerase-3 subunit epsilon [Anseongella ginsenosidimutans]|uniref:DNA polymerase-3 subunit epsilon n=1 Tax=Anseongella ginsenosidimutans TaxID=496056 RepID=A0A4V2UTS5_9SPHI|nr:exonuclease domain-containing protein [Anseongella ginsenosidimutans]QEC53009.1 DNA polymerase III subunit epsilon [Anseongella ginsenosidimutans]TCS87416.1 DNA polymerase-3 subunit epsilon [Anseongella ginsenosidimutans]